MTRMCGVSGIGLMLVLVWTSMCPADLRGQSQSTRLMAFGPNGMGCATGLPGCSPLPTGHSLFEIDPGTDWRREIPLSVTTPSYLGLTLNLGYDSTMNSASGLMYVYERMPGGLLHAMDVATGTVVSTTTLGLDFRYFEYESSTSRLLAFRLSGGVPDLVTIDPLSGAVTVVGQTGGYPAMIPEWNALSRWNGYSALDDQNHRLFVPGGGGLLCVDTMSGAVLSVLPVQGPPFNIPLSEITGMEFDSTANRIMAFKQAGTPPNLGLLYIDPVTGGVINLGNPNDPVFFLATSAVSAAFDEQRSRYYIAGSASSALGWGTRLRTYDTVSGALLSEPFAQDELFYRLGVLEVDASTVPIMGRVELSTANVVVPGSSLQLEFQAPGHSGAFYLPFVSCTQGLLAIPGTALTVPLTFDACSTFYFTDPLASAIFGLTPAGSVFGTLSSSGQAFGTVMMPSFQPVGGSLLVWVTFITIDPMSQVVATHGGNTIHFHY